MNKFLFISVYACLQLIQLQTIQGLDDRLLCGSANTA